MGNWFSQSIINAWIVQHLRSFTKDGNVKFGMKKLKARFHLQRVLGRENAPTCHVYIRRLSVQCQDLQFDAQPQLRMRASKITVMIEKIVVRCDDLGYMLRLRDGKITLVDVNITALYKLKIRKCFKVSDIEAEVKVKKMETDINLEINGIDYSRLANVLLTIDNPKTVSKLFKTIFMAAKEDIKKGINENIDDIAKECDLKK